MTQDTRTAGDLLRRWRHQRRLSQLALAVEAEISQRHLSYVESGRAQPSREMVTRLTEVLRLPLRERNAVLLAAGYAPVFPRRDFDAPDFTRAREAIGQILDAHQPHPALAVDRYWTLIRANTAALALMQGASGALTTPPVNVLRLSLSPDGLAGRVLNLAEWRTHVLARLARDVDTSGDPRLAALLEELKSMPGPQAAAPEQRIDDRSLAVPLRLASPAGPLAFISTTTVFGTAVDVTLSEITIETFFPADAETARALRSTDPDSPPGT
ncbi:MAG: helix-turn-helix domain-containing protein [Lautropia sp.]